MVLSLRHGLTLKTLASRYALEPYLISKITNMVTRLLATKLYPEFIKIPVAPPPPRRNDAGFQKITPLPNVCGAIDTTPLSVKGQPVRPYIVGDWSFPLLSFLMTPFSYDRTGSPAQNAFDEALMKGRKAVAREPEPELWKEPRGKWADTGMLENEKSCYYYGGNLRQLLPMISSTTVIKMRGIATR
ncbi:hypothetical protein SASPL_131875 [Salvia splendens]|uniref:DDE Tnp4 domain-containing protein n=1 Tax=Salvia splendens TaxID=180675 RepID=A0A8X8X8I6_SALSN|nr:hypothetical protein SASPL_131875 [Salvia splendens]